MKKALGIMVAVIMALTVFAIPDSSFAATKAPGKVKSSTIKMTVVNGNSLKFAWGTAKTGKKVLKKTCYQVQYKVEVMQDSGKYKVTTKWKSLKKGKNRYHVYKGIKGNKYRVSLRVRAYNGKKFGPWSATQAKAKKIVKTIPAFTPKYSAFTPSLSQFGDNRAVTRSGFLNSQGCVFDTYTGTDGYNFAMSDGDGTGGVDVIHFTLVNDTISQVGSEHILFNTAGNKPGDYTREIGHANDGTIYQREDGKKYMFVAISGGKEKSSTDSAGKSIKLAYIDMGEYAAYEDYVVNGMTVGDEPPALPKIYGVTIKTNGVKMSSTLAESKFSGVALTDKTRNGHPIVVLKDGRTFYATELTFSGNTPVLTFFDSARIVKPTIKHTDGKTYDASTQGITYHNNYLYVTYSGETNASLNTWMLIGRITYAHMFSDTYSDLRNLQTFKKQIAGQASNGTITKNIPEALFFTNITGLGNLYISTNRGTNASSGSDCDAIYKSAAQY